MEIKDSISVTFPNEPYPQWISVSTVRDWSISDVREVGDRLFCLANGLTVSFDAVDFFRIFGGDSE